MGLSPGCFATALGHSLAQDAGKIQAHGWVHPNHKLETTGQIFVAVHGFIWSLGLDNAVAKPWLSSTQQQVAACSNQAMVWLSIYVWRRPDSQPYYHSPRVLRQRVYFTTPLADFNWSHLAILKKPGQTASVFNPSKPLGSLAPTACAFLLQKPTFDSSPPAVHSWR